MDINDNLYSIDFTDSATWNKLIRKSAIDQAPASFTPTLTARRRINSITSAYFEHAHPDHSALTRISNAYEKDMFLVMAKPVLEVILLLWENLNDDALIYR
jgi:hypothetical protein